MLKVYWYVGDLEYGILPKYQHLHEFSTYQGLFDQVYKYLTGEIIVLVSSLLVKRDVM